MMRCSCGGVAKVYSTKTRGLHRTRYLRCENCGDTSKQRVAIAADGRAKDLLPMASTKIVECRECGCRMQVQG